MNVHGNSATATKLATARNIKLQGAVSGNVNFDGSGNVIINTTQANIAILSGTVTLTDGTGSVDIKYPSGFTRDNCIVFSTFINITSGWNDFYLGQSTVVCGASLRSDKIKFTCSPVSSSGPSGTKNFKIYLMKIS